MTNPGLNPYLGLGGLHGGHWTSNQTAHDYSSLGANYANQGALSGLAAQQAAFNAYAQAAHDARYSVVRTIERAGIKAGEIIAWRCWKLKRDKLTSMAMDTVWVPGKAVTGRVDQLVGVHSFKEKDDAVQYGLDWPLYPVIVGTVKLWGEVLEWERGYTAENGKIASLESVLHGSRFKWRNNRTLKRVRENYQLVAND